MKGRNMLKEFLDSELGDYSYFKVAEILLNEEYANYEYYDVTIKNLNEKLKELRFRYDLENNTLEIELSEDMYEEINEYEWRVKYFWMALLKWE